MQDGDYYPRNVCSTLQLNIYKQEKYYEHSLNPELPKIYWVPSVFNRFHFSRPNPETETPLASEGSK